jgi:hypothetical protein
MIPIPHSYVVFFTVVNVKAEKKRIHKETDIALENSPELVR